MKVIFLDIDGVLNRIGCKDLIHGIYFVMDEKILLLKEIIEATDAKIVLSSTWRYGIPDVENGVYSENAFDYLALEKKLAEFDIEIMSHTPISDPEFRGHEIDEWLQTWKGETIESFVILDDGDRMKPHNAKLVQTSFMKGLEPKHVKKAINILNN